MKITKDSLPNDCTGLVTGGHYICKSCLMEGEILEGIPVPTPQFEGCVRCQHKNFLRYRETFRARLATDVKDFIQGNRDELSLHDPATKFKAILEILIDRVADLEFVSLNSRP